MTFALSTPEQFPNQFISGCVLHDKVSSAINGNAHVHCICLTVKFCCIYMGESISTPAPHFCLNLPKGEAGNARQKLVVAL